MKEIDKLKSKAIKLIRTHLKKKSETSMKLVEEAEKIYERIIEIYSEKETLSNEEVIHIWTNLVFKAAKGVK